eukprot:Awhi_evm1s13917
MKRQHFKTKQHRSKRVHFEEGSEQIEHEENSKSSASDSSLLSNSGKEEGESGEKGERLLEMNTPSSSKDVFVGQQQTIVNSKEILKRNYPLFNFKEDGIARLIWSFHAFKELMDDKDQPRSKYVHHIMKALHSWNVPTGVDLSNDSLTNEDCGSVLGLVIRDVVHQNPKGKPELDLISFYASSSRQSFERDHPERLTDEERVQRIIEAFSQLTTLRKEVEKAAERHPDIENIFKMSERKMRSLICHLAISMLKPLDRILVNDSKSKINGCALVKSKAIKYDKDFARRKEKTPRPQPDRNKKQGNQFLCKTCKPPGSTSDNRLHTADCEWVKKNSKKAAEQNKDKTKKCSFFQPIFIDRNFHLFCESHNVSTLECADYKRPRINVRFGTKLVALVDRCSNTDVIDFNSLNKMNVESNLSFSRQRRNIPIELANYGSVANAKGQMTSNVTLSTGIVTTVTKPLVMDLDNRSYQMIIGVDTCDRLGISMSGLPPPHALDYEEEKDDQEMLNIDNPMEDIDCHDYFGIRVSLSKLLEENERIAINDRCTLPDAVVKFDITAEALKREFKSKNYRNYVSQAHTEITDETIKKWIVLGIIEIHTTKTE